MDKTVIFWIYDKDEYESEAGEDSEDVVVPFWDRALDYGIDPQGSVSISMHEKLVDAIREAIGITHSDEPDLEEELRELGESFSDSGFKISFEVYLKMMELLVKALEEIDDDLDRIGAEVDIAEIKDGFADVDWENQVVFANT